MTPSDDLDVISLARVARDVATEAAALIVDERPPGLGVMTTKTSAVDIVTEMDQRAQDLLRSRLGELRPDDAFLGEEEGSSDGTSAITWVVDPIDGTVNYLYGIPAYCVSVAAVTGDPREVGQWRPVAGAVVNPVTGERFHAARGQGAYRAVGAGEATRLAASGASDLATALIGTGFGYVAPRRRWQADVLAQVLPAVRDIRRMGSAALDLCHVADGALDGYYERGLNPWDFAAGWLVATEAGALVTDEHGGAPSGAMIVAARPGLHAALSGELRSAIAVVTPETP